MKHSLLALLTLLTIPAAQAQLAITAVTPMPNARTVARTSPLTVTFNQPLTAASATALQVYSAQRGGLLSRANAAALVTGNTLSYAPTPYSFRPGETLQYTVTTAATGSSALATPRVGQFTTAVGGTGVGIFPPIIGGAVTGSGPAFDAQLGDVDNDGDLDMLAVNGRASKASTVSVRLNDGTGTFSGLAEIPVGTSSYALAVGDLDRDGDLDFVATNGTTSSISVRLNYSSGTIFTGQDMSVTGFPQGLALGDVDGDGDLDLVVANASAAVAVLINNGDAYFTTGTPAAVAGDSHHVALGDVDGDGDLDLLTALDNANAVSVRFNNGAGVFSGTGIVPVGTSPYKLALGDLDGDGDLDFVTANSVTSGTLSVRLNDGTGTFGGGGEIAVGAYPQSVALGDLDGDGDLDLLTANQSGASVAVRLNNGNATFNNTRADVVLPPSPRSVAMGDIDGDGDLDFITSHSNATGTVLIGLNGGTAPSPAPTLLSFTPASGLVGSTITLTGTNLASPTAVIINGTLVTAFTVNSAGTQLTLTVPAGATTGPIRVTTPGGTATSATAFTVLPSAPVVSSFTPASGVVGSIVVLTGTDLSGASNITINGTLVTAFSVNPVGTQLTLTVPTGATTGPIRVTTPGGTTTTATAFTVLPSAPVVNSFTPASGLVGTVVTLTGTNLSGASAVTVNGTLVTAFTVNSAGTQLTLTVPAGATTGPIRVTTPGGTATSATAFTVLTNTPVVSSFTPMTGVAGTMLTLTGTRLGGASAVTVNGTAASFTVVNATTITAKVPVGATTGSISVTTAGGTGASAGTFTVLQSAPGPIVVDGYRESRYGTAAAVQTTFTGFGNATNGSPTTSLGGSELDAAYTYVHGDSLYVFLAGNLENNGNTLDIFFDSKAGGQNVLTSTNPNVDGNGLNALAGLTFDTGFAADYYLTVKGLSPGGVISAAFASLGTTGTGISPASTGTGQVVGLALPGNLAGTLAINQSNTGGVDDTAVLPGAPAAVVTGIEFVLPLAVLNAQSGLLRITAFVGNGTHNVLSNQVLGGLPVGTGNLTNPTNVNFNAYTGSQYFATPVVLATAPVALTAGVQVYPNPTQGRFTLEVPTTGSVRVLNALGQVVCMHTVPGGKAELSLSGQAPGIYTVCVQTGAHTVVKRIVLTQ